MASSQANPAYSSTTESANPANPITAPESTTTDHKLTFGERHRAPTTKDVETNRWTGAAPGTAKTGPAGGFDGRGVDREGEAGYDANTRAAEFGNGNAYNDADVRTGEVRGEGMGYGNGSENMTGNMAGNGAGYGNGADNVNGVEYGGATTGTGYQSTTTEPASEGAYESGGVRNDGVMDGETGQKKTNPLKKVVNAVKNI